MRRYYQKSATSVLVQRQCICCMQLFYKPEIDIEGHCQGCHSAETITEGLPNGTAIKIIGETFIPLYTDAGGWLRSYGSPDWNNRIVMAHYPSFEEAQERILR